MKTIRFLAITVISALTFTACNKDDYGIDPITGGGEIVFNIGIAPQVETRVATDAQFKSTWVKGDQIGIFAVKRATSTPTATLAASGNYMHNVNMTYDGTKWTSTSKLWYASGSEVLDFYAYYPYDAAATNPANITFNVKADQTTAANYNKSDLLKADKVSGIAKGIAVDLQFKHMLALVQVDVDPTYVDHNGGFTATLRGCKAGGAFNLGTGNLTIDGSAQPQAVKMLRMEQPTDLTYTTKYTYRALVPAQTVKENTNLCLMVQNGQLFNTPTLTVALALKAGEAKRYTAELPATALATVAIKNGIFLMGSSDGSNIGDGDGSGLNTTAKELNRGGDETQHEVTLTKDFYMGKYAITNAQYAVFLNATNVGADRKATVSGFGEQLLFDVNASWNVNLVDGKWVAARADIPMINVAWYGAKAYADWAGGSLPTEAQWEYACRAGTASVYSFGDDATQLGNYAWYSVNSGKQTHPIGEKLPNPWGLYDMHGNVFEWCSDFYDSNYGNNNQAATNPEGPATGSDRVMRGGSWDYGARHCRSAYRDGDYPAYRFDFVGFRVVFIP